MCFIFIAALSKKLKNGFCSNHEETYGTRYSHFHWLNDLRREAKLKEKCDRSEFTVQNDPLPLKAKSYNKISSRFPKNKHADLLLTKNAIFDTLKNVCSSFFVKIVIYQTRCRWTSW